MHCTRGQRQNSLVLPCIVLGSSISAFYSHKRHDGSSCSRSQFPHHQPLGHKLLVVSQKGTMITKKTTTTVTTIKPMLDANRLAPLSLFRQRTRLEPSLLTYSACPACCPRRCSRYSTQARVSNKINSCPRSWELYVSDRPDKTRLWW